MKNIVLNYLYIGAGNACDGHRIAKSASATYWSTVGNFGILGLTLPKGSAIASKINYLYTGTGKAWAGQSNVTVKALLDWNPLKLSVAGNLGRTLPIGSDKLKNNVIWSSHIYLYLGTGKACAGQRSVRLSSKKPLKVRDISMVGNLGKTLPTGSKQNKPFKLVL